jgi:hypothetical protein
MEMMPQMLDPSMFMNGQVPQMMFPIQNMPQMANMQPG